MLNKIAEMSAALQAKLLRVLHDGRFQRVGSNKELHTNARILASTNRDLKNWSRTENSARTCTTGST